MPDMSNTDNWSDAQNRAFAASQTVDGLDWIEACARAIGTAIGSTHGRYQGAPTVDDMVLTIEGWLEAYAYEEAKRHYGLDREQSNDLSESRWPREARASGQWGTGVYGMASYVAWEAARDAYAARFPEKEGGAK